MDLTKAEELRQIVQSANECSQKGEDPAGRLPAFSPAFLNTFYAFAYRFYREGKYQEATDFFRFLTLIRPYEKRGWMGLGAAEQMSKNYHRALSAYAFLCVLDDQDPYPHFHAAECYLALNDVIEGLLALNAAGAACDDSPEHLDLKKKIALMRERWGESLGKNGLEGYVYARRHKEGASL